MQKKDKKKMELPPNFQEEMMNCELEFQHEINETNIRKLIYVYTLGMQYYNIKDKQEFENYYRTKLNNLLLNEDVINYLDRNRIDLSKNVELNMFKENKSPEENNSNKIKEEKKSILKKSKDDLEIKTSPSFDILKKKGIMKKEELLEYVKRKIKEVDLKLVSIDKQVSNNIVDQMAVFESKKRNKKVRKPKNIIEKEDRISEASKEGIVSRESSDSISYDIEVPDLEINKKPKKSTKRRGSSIGQTKLLKEIEEYVEHNMKEMYKAIEELKQSYEGEINEAVESGFEEIAESLRNDLKFEIESLTAQYEEERMKQIELIREKNKNANK